MHNCIISATLPCDLALAYAICAHAHEMSLDLQEEVACKIKIFFIIVPMIIVLSQLSRQINCADHAFACSSFAVTAMG